MTALARITGVALLVVLTGCSGGSGSKSAPTACVQALDAADQGFTALSEAISETKQAFDVGMNGNPQQASAMLRQIRLPSSARYKRLEAACRASG